MHQTTSQPTHNTCSVCSIVLQCNTNGSASLRAPQAPKKLVHPKHQQAHTTYNNSSPIMLQNHTQQTHDTRNNLQYLLYFTHPNYSQTNTHVVSVLQNHTPHPHTHMKHLPKTMSFLSRNHIPTDTKHLQYLFTMAQHTELQQNRSRCACCVQHEAPTCTNQTQ